MGGSDHTTSSRQRPDSLMVVKGEGVRFWCQAWVVVKRDGFQSVPETKTAQRAPEKKRAGQGRPPKEPHELDRQTPQRPGEGSRRPSARKRHRERSAHPGGRPGQQRHRNREASAGAAEHPQEQAQTTAPELSESDRHGPRREGEGEHPATRRNGPPSRQGGTQGHRKQAATEGSSGRDSGSHHSGSSSHRRRSGRSSRSRRNRRSRQSDRSKSDRNRHENPPGKSRKKEKKKPARHEAEPPPGHPAGTPVYKQAAS